MADLPQPYFDPSQYPAYLDAQRKQQIAQMLMSGLQSANQTPSDWNSMKVVPKRGMMQNVSVLADALLAKKGMDASNAATSNYMGGLFGGGQPAAAPFQAAPYDANAAAQAPEGIAAPPPGPGSPTNTPTAPVAPQQPRQSGGMPSLTGDPTRDRQFFYTMGPEKYMEAVAQRYGMTDQQKNDAANGVTPQQRLAITLSDVKPVRGSTAIASVDAQGNPVAVPITGLEGNIASRAGAEAKATAENTPHFVEDPFHPGKFTTTWPTKPGDQQPSGANPVPPGGTPNAAAAPPKAPQNAASLEGQKTGAQDGIKYANEIQQGAANALEGKRALSEMQNNLSGFKPGAGAPILSGIGSVAQALGVPPDRVAKLTGVNPGDVQAFQRSSSALAEAAGQNIKDPGAKADFKSFIEKNPTWMMSPQGLQKFMDFTSRGLDAPIAKQQAFSKYSQSASPDKWRNEFDAQWNKEEAARISAGQYNSNNTQAPQYAEGQIAHNPQTGQTLVRKGGQWVAQ